MIFSLSSNFLVINKCLRKCVSNIRKSEEILLKMLIFRKYQKPQKRSYLSSLAFIIALEADEAGGYLKERINCP